MARLFVQRTTDIGPTCLPFERSCAAAPTVQTLALPGHVRQLRTASNGVVLVKRELV